MTVPLDHPLAGLWSAHAWRDGPQQSARDTASERKGELQRRLDTLLSKQRPKINAPDVSPPYRPTRESIVAALSHDPAPSAPTQYPRTMRAPSYANPDFDVRRGTTGLCQPSYGVGEAWRYGRGAGGEENVGTPTPGSLLTASGRYRIGERPSLRGARRMPPNKQYGTKDGKIVDRSGPRTAPLDGVHQYIEQQSETSENPYRKPLLVGNATQPLSRRPSRRQGYMKQAANVQGELHTARYLGDDEHRRRRKKKRIAQLQAKRCELLATRDVLIAQSKAKLVELKVFRDSLRKQQQEEALTQADAALQSINNKFVKGYHSDSSFFRLWEKATELVKQEQAQQTTMKGLT